MYGQDMSKELTEITNKGDFHGVSESKIITEHRCTMEATMRLEHKTAHLDLPTLTKRPITPTPTITTGQDTTDATATQKMNVEPNPPPMTKVTPPVMQTPTTNMHIFKPQLPTTFEVTNKTNEIQTQSLTSEQSIKSSLNELLTRSEKSKTAAKQISIEIPIKQVEEQAVEIKSFNLEPGSPPEICFAPNTEVGSSVQATIEKIEQIAPSSTQTNTLTNMTPQTIAHTTLATKDVKIEVAKPQLRSPATLSASAEMSLRSPSPKCSAEGAAMTRLWGKPMSNNLNAPLLVKEASESITANYGLLEPGSPPIICYAPKTTERRQSLVETMERTLEKNLQQGPTKVLPHSVPTLTPPSASPANIQKPKPPPPTMPTHLSATRFDICESDYESDRYKYSGSESDETSLRSKLPTYNAPVPQPATPIKSSGYAADTEDPHTNQYLPYSNKLPFEKQAPAPIYYTTTNGHEQMFEHEYKNDKQDSFTSSQTCNILYKNNATTVTPVKLAQTTNKPGTVLPIPSVTTARQTPAEFSDYSSEVEERFRSVSRNYESEADIKGYRVVFPPTPTPTKIGSGMGNGHKSPIVVVTPSPMEFEPAPPAVSTFARPKFEPIQQSEQSKEYRENEMTTQHSNKQTQYQMQTQQRQQQQQQQQQTTQMPQHVFKPKPVAAKFLAATQQQQSKFSEPRETGTTLYYNAFAGTPLHTAKCATETTNLTELESSNTCQRVMNMQRTKQVYHFESQQEKTMSSSQYESYSSPSGASTPAHQVRLPKPPTPTKFIPCELRESNYKSEVENAKIRPLWSPYGEKGYMRYRHVNAPQGGERSASLPRSYERVLSPMDFDSGPEMPTNIFDKLRQEKLYTQPNTQTLQRHSSLRSTSSSQKHAQQYRHEEQSSVTRYPQDDMNLKVGSPPKYGYITGKAQDQGQHMQSTFMQKSSKFMEDISSDIKRSSYTTPTLQRHVKVAAAKPENSVPQAYRDETRVSQYGK